MAVIISREASFGERTRAFRFDVVKDAASDQTIYEAGREFERAASRAGSLGRRIFMRLSESGQGKTESKRDEK